MHTYFSDTNEIIQSHKLITHIEQFLKAKILAKLCSRYNTDVSGRSNKCVKSEQWFGGT